MADMVQSAAMSQTAVVVMDYASSQTAPSSAGYKVDIGDITETQTQPDPNPDVERVRFLIDYSFTFRANYYSSLPPSFHSMRRAIILRALHVIHAITILSGESVAPWRVNGIT